MKNCILIYPPNSSVYAIKHQSDYLYYSEEYVVVPTGLLCLATYCKNNGDFNINILNLSYEYVTYLEELKDESRKSGNGIDFDYEEYLRDILTKYCIEYKPELIGISGLFDHSLGHIRLISSIVKQLSKDIIVVAGGNAVTNMPGKFLETDTDAVTLGHGEEPLFELMNSSDPNKYLSSSLKWATKSKPDSQHNLYTKLNDISPLRWDLIDLNAYQKLLGISKGLYNRGKSPRRIASLVSSRGCPFKCSFCAMHTVHGRTVHSVDVSRFLEEVKFLHNEYDINVLSIEDDTFNFNKKRAIEILEGIHKISNKIEVEIPSGFALQLMDEELIATLKNCGVKWQQIAIESANKEILNKVIYKPLKIEKAIEVIDLLQKYDIYVRAFFILGFPTETKEQMEETIQFMLDNRINWNGIGMLKPISGSEIREVCEDSNYIITSDSEMSTERLGSIRTEHFTPEEVDEIVYNANIKVNFVNNYDLFRGGKPEKAIIGFDNVLTRAPEHLFALYYKAVAYERMNDNENAIEYFRKANSVMQSTNKWDKLVEEHGLKDLIERGTWLSHKVGA
jgi:radical SAM superfamily enzyme YgiQ (UPF0313 family)